MQKRVKCAVRFYGHYVGPDELVCSVVQIQQVDQSEEVLKSGGKIRAGVSYTSSGKTV